MSPPLLIQAVVSKAERAALIAAFEQLCGALGAASGIAWPVKLDFRPSLSANRLVGDCRHRFAATGARAQRRTQPETVPVGGKTVLHL